MVKPQLLFVTGHPNADRTLRAVIGLTELLLPGRVIGYYLHGSYRDGTWQPTSDIDIVAVLRTDVPDRTADLLRQTLAVLGSAAAVPPDVIVAREDELRDAGAVWLRDAATLLFGQDIAATFSALSHAGYARRAMHAAFTNLARRYDRGAFLSYPLAPPDLDDPWLGYARVPVRLPDGSEVLGTSALVSTASWVATALSMSCGADYTQAKGEVIARRYREAVTDEWSDFLDELFRRCRADWRYLIPDGADDRTTLRVLCERAVGFFNHFLVVYRAFLLVEVGEGMPARQFAVRRLGEIVFPDPEVRTILAGFTIDGPLATTAATALARIDELTGRRPRA